MFHVELNEIFNTNLTTAGYDGNQQTKSFEAITADRNRNPEMEGVKTKLLQLLNLSQVYKCSL